LPTPSTPSTHTPDHPMHSPSPPTFHISTLGPSRYQQLPIVNRPVSSGMQSILESLQREHISEHGRERPHHSTSTSDVQDLHHALADMFGLPPLPIYSLLLIDPPPLWQPYPKVNRTVMSRASPL
jgi:hypothetical protein